MKLVYVILFMMATTAVFGRTLKKRDRGEHEGGEHEDGEHEDGEHEDGDHKKPTACSCFTDDGPGGDDSGDDSSHEGNNGHRRGDNDGNNGRFDGHSSYGRLNRYTPASDGPGRYGSYCRNDDGHGSGNVRSCPAALSGCRTDCCRYCCFSDPRMGGD